MKNILLVPELRELLAENNPQSLREFCESSHPADIAEFLSGLEPDEIGRVLSCADPRTRVAIFPYFDIDVQLALAERMRRAELVELISNMSSDERVDFIKKLPEEEIQLLMPGIAQAEREDIRKLASHPEGTAGAVMSSDYATLSARLTVQEAIEKLRLEAPDKETIYYSYVIDDQRKLIGIVSLKDLILARPNQRMADIMHPEPIYARVDEDQEEVARKIEKYDLIAIPVINGGGGLVGIVTHDDAMDILRVEQTEDMERFMGLTGQVQEENYLSVPAVVHFRRRAIWLVGLAMFGLVSGAILELFENVLTTVFVLAFYMPMLAGTGGNTGSQAATVVIRALALRQITAADIPRVLWKELRVSLMLSLILVIVAIARIYLFTSSSDSTGGFSLVRVGTVVVLALGIQVISSTLIGAILPIVASKFKVDPAVVASPALATAVDITGLLIYFGLAKLLLGV
jgi:magnesium transporter